jgi:2-dehydro-3-deoxyphosphogluconate aldolase / (4S)-4-hydroxy-2-oxoglutarate aldolase
MDKSAVRARIEEVGIIPSIRTASAGDARFAAEAISGAGVPIVEITMTVPGALQVIAALARDLPDLVVGAGTVLDMEMARGCVDAGARFLTSPGLDLQIVKFALQAQVLVLPGALTPTEVTAAWRSGADLIKIFPCAQLGGDGYIRALKAPFPTVPLIAAGGVNQHTAADFIRAGAVAIGVGTELIPKRAVEQRRVEWIVELARRFLSLVKDARGHHESTRAE